MFFGAAAKLPKKDTVEDPDNEIRYTSVEVSGKEIRKDIAEMKVDNEEVIEYQGDIWDSSDDDLYVAYDTSEMVIEADQMECAEDSCSLDINENCGKRIVKTLWKKYY